MEVTDGICSYSVVSQLENGRNIPSAKIMGKLAARLGVPLKEIMGMQEKQLEVNFQLDIIRVYIEIEDFTHALEIVLDLEKSNELLEYQSLEIQIAKAECLIWTQRPDEAISILSTLHHELESKNSQDYQLLARIYNMIGTASFISSDVLRAFSYYKRAYEITLRFPEFNKLAAEIAYNLGYVCNETGYHHEAVSYLDQARKFFDGADNIRKLAKTLFSSAIAYKNVGEIVVAEEYLKQALVLYETEKCFKLASIVRQHQAFYVTSSRDPKAAIRELIDCRNEFVKFQDYSLAVYTNARIAMICIENNETLMAELYLNDGNDLIASHKLVDDTRLAYFFFVFAKYCLMTEQLEDCVELSEKSSQIFAIMNLAKESAKSLDVSVEAFERMGKIQSALENAKRIKQILLNSDGGLRV